MRQFYFIFLLVIGGTVCFFGYCAALIDWVQDYRTGVYEKNHVEAFLETTGLSLYTALGICFVKRKTPLL